MADVSDASDASGVGEGADAGDVRAVSDVTDVTRPAPGTIGWTDLTVENADEVRDFYCAVAGWRYEGEDMGGYEDYHMIAPGGETVAGVVHARGMNADLPPQWLVYISVPDLDASMRACAELGGLVIAAPKDLGHWGRLCVIQDPAGAVAALIEPPK